MPSFVKSFRLSSKRKRAPKISSWSNGVDNRISKRGAVGRHGEAIIHEVREIGLEERRHGDEHDHLADENGHREAGTCKEPSGT